MKINFDIVITNLDGKEMTDDGKPASLKNISITALMGNIQVPQGTPPEKGDVKLKRYILAQKINGGGEIDLAVEDVALLKERIGLIYATLIVGKTYELLDPKGK